MTGESKQDAKQIAAEEFLKLHSKPQPSFFGFLFFWNNKGAVESLDLRTGREMQVKDQPVDNEKINAVTSQWKKTEYSVKSGRDYNADAFVALHTPKTYQLS